MTVEFTVVVDRRVDRQVRCAGLVLTQRGGRPVRTGVLLIDLIHLIVGEILPGTLPVLAEIGNDVVGEVTLHREPFGQPSEIPIGREGRVQGVDLRLVVARQVLHQHRRVRTAAQHAVGIIGASGRLHVRGDVEDAVIVAREGRVILVLLTGRQVEADLEALGHLHVEVRTNAVLLIFSSALLIDTILILAVELHEITQFVRTAAHRYTVFVLGREGFDDRVHPVGIGIADGVRTVAVFLNLLGGVHRRRSVDRPRGVIGLGIEHGIGHLDQTRGLLQAEIVVKSDPGRRVYLSSLGCHENDAVGRPRTVDSGRRILQHGDAFYLVA